MVMAVAQKSSDMQTIDTHDNPPSSAKQKLSLIEARGINSNVTYIISHTSELYISYI